MSKKTKKFKKFKKILKNKNIRIATVCVMALVVVGVAFALMRSMTVEAADAITYGAYYGVNNEFRNEYVVNNKVYTPTNKMKILEIVPSAEQGELGYLCGNGDNDGFVSITDISKIKDSAVVNYAGSTQKVRDVLVAYRNDQLSFLIHGNCDLSDKGYFYGDLGYSGEGGNKQNKYRLGLSSLVGKAGYRTETEYVMGADGDIPLLSGYDRIQTGTDANNEPTYRKYFYRNYLAYMLFGNAYMENKLEVVVKGAGEVTPEDFDNCDMVYLSRAGHGNGNISKAIELMKTLTPDDFTSDGEAIVAKYKNATFAESFSTTQTDIYGNVMDLSDEALSALYEFYASDRAFILDYSAKVEGTNVAKAVQVVGGISSSAFYKQFCKETANGQTVNLGNGYTVNNLTGFYGEFGYYDAINKKFHIAFPDDGSWTNENGSDVWKFVEAGPQNWQSKYSFSYDYDKHKWKVNENTADKLYVNFLGNNYEVTKQTKWMQSANANVTAYFPNTAAFDVDSSLRYATTNAFGSVVSLSYSNGKWVNNTIKSVPKEYATITADWGGGYVEFNGKQFQGQLSGDTFTCYNPISISLDLNDANVTYLEKMPSSYILSSSLGGYVINNGTTYYGEIIDGKISIPDLYFQQDQLTAVTEEYDAFDYDRFGITIRDTSVPWADDMFYAYISGGIMRTVENINSPSPTVSNPCTDYYHATTNPNGQTDDSRYIYNGTSAFTMNLQKEADICNLSMQRLYKNSKDAYKQITYLYAPDGHPTGVNVIQYLLGIFPGKTSDTVHILEIQPAGYYDYSLYDTSMMTRKVKNFQTAIDLVSYIGGNSSMLTSKNYRNKVKVDSVSVTAFDGLNKDILTDYDLIIFGIKSGVSGYTVMNAAGTDYIREDSDVLDSTVLNKVNYKYDKAYSINTDRRDNALDGLIYTPVGDYYELSVGNGSDLANLQALEKTKLYDDYTVTGYTRGSGTDLTYKAYDKLIQYLNDKEMPIIFADDIYNGNKTTIGSTTNVYKLSEYALNSNVVTFEEAARTHELGLKNAYWHVLDQRVYFDITKPVNLAYKAGSDGKVDLVSENESNVIYKEADEDINIEFEGSIRGSVKPVASTYKYTLYIDKNGDGILRTDVVRDDHNEVFASGELTVSPTGVLESMTVEGEDEDFNAVVLNSDDDTTGTFKLNVTLTESMTGYMSWRLVVEELAEENAGIISSTNGEFIVLDKKKKTVNVLQLIPDNSASRKTAYKEISGAYVANGNNTDAIRLIIEKPDADGLGWTSNSRSVLATASTVYASSVSSMLKSSKKFNELFEAASKITGIDMKVTTLSTTAFEDMFLYLHDDKMDYLLDDSGKKQRDLNDTVNYRDSDDYDDKLRNPLKAMKIDMVVIGFADNYSRDALGNRQGAISCLKEFAARGKSILFSHDTFPYTGYSDGYMTADFDQIHYGSGALNTMTTMLRSVSGQDRYGVTEALDKNGNPDPNSYYWSTEADGKLPTIEINGETKSYGQLGQLQGFSYNILYRHSQKVTGGNKVEKLLPKFSTLYNGMTSDASPDLNYTNKVTRLNQGQVTQYPYLIAEKLSVAKTHSQWYQIDLEAKENKSEEVVVWFTLSDGESSNNEALLYANKGLDPINDYYIFSKGTITYSGAGHSDISDTQVAEQKLFINTIIRALVAANSAPKASFETAVLTDELKDEYTQYIRKPLQDSGVAVDEKGHLQSLIVTFIGKDADMRKGDRNNELSKLYAGQFSEAYVYWDVNKNGRFDIEDVKLETYPSASNDYAYNNIPISIDLFNYRDVRDSKGNKLGDSVNNNTCQLGVVYRDSQDSGSATCKLVLRELFELN